MILSSTVQSVRRALYAFISVAFGAFNVCLAQREGEQSAMLRLSPAYVPVPGVTTAQMHYDTVEWEGIQYDASEGTKVLMKVATDSDTDATQRTKALQQLKRLRNRDITPHLVGLYDTVSERSDKLGIMSCLISSQDAHGFPLFARVLEHENDDMVKLFAAVALAQWNVRRGVAELIDVLAECKDGTLGDRTVCNEAAKEFLWFNARKGWGFPEANIRTSIQERTDLQDEEKSALFVSEIKKWWTKNRERFPDWKPGDPLPETEPTQPPKEKP